MTLEQLKRDHIASTLKAYGWNKAKAGRELGLSREGVIYACRTLGIDATPPVSVVKQWGLRTRMGGSVLTITAEHGSNIDVRASNGEVFSIGRQTLRYMLEQGDLVMEVLECKPSN